MPADGDDGYVSELDLRTQEEDSLILEQVRDPFVVSVSYLQFVVQERNAIAHRLSKGMTARELVAQGFDSTLVLDVIENLFNNQRSGKSPNSGVKASLFKGSLCHE